MAFVAEWIRPTEKALTAEQVKRLEPGARVTVIGADRYGECYREDGTIVQSGKKKLLCFINKVTWEKVYKPIKDSENKRYVIAKGERA